MTYSKRWHALWLLAGLLGLWGVARYFQGTPSRPADASTTEAPVTYAFEIFNTYGRLTLYGTSKEFGDPVNAKLQQRLRQLHDTINAYDPASELSSLNRTAHEVPFRCSPMLWDILMAAKEAHRLSEGCFDVTVGPLMHLWGFHEKKGSVPTEEEIQAALQNVGFGKLRLDEAARTVAFPHEGMRIDFGGIAKGFALDLAADLLETAGLSCYLLDLGGNIHGKGGTAHPVFTIGVRNPMNPQALLGTLSCTHEMIATSGNYERFRMLDGKKVGHIMDPRTGHPCDYLAGVTVVTTRGVLSDVLSTTAFVGGRQLAAKLVQALPETSFIFVDAAASGVPLPEVIGPHHLSQIPNS